MIDKLIQFDHQLFFSLNSIHSNFWDFVMWWTSAIITWIPLYLVILFFIFKKQQWKGFLTVIFIIVLILFADQISVHLFKNVFQRLRPCHNPDFVGLIHLVNNKCGGSFGFISSHAANTFALAVFSSLYFKKKYYSYFILIWASFVSYSRIYLGVHYPGDILGGALLGALIGYLIFLSYEWSHKKIYKQRYI